MQKIKQFIESDKGKDVLTILIVVLVGLGGFGLGRMSKQGQGTGIRIIYPNGEEIPVNRNFEPQDMPAQSVTSLKNQGSGGVAQKAFFASSRGSKYYPANCTAGKSIKVDNRIYFSTREEAEAAGYEISNSCR